MTTPAQRKGLVIGQSYIYNAENEPGHALNGQSVTFKEDDGTDVPEFYVPKDYDSEGWAYLCLKNIQVGTSPAEPSVVASTEFSVQVAGGSTTITVRKSLTAEQVAAMLAAAGVK